MKDQSRKSPRKTSKDTPSATSSAGSEDGHTPSDLPVGTPVDLFGVPLSPVNPFQLPGRGRDTRTNDISSRLFKVLSRSVCPPSSSGNKYPAPSEWGGSMEYKMHWKQKATPSGRSYYQLVASAHRTSGKDFSGWPTAASRDVKGGYEGGENTQREDKHGHPGCSSAVDYTRCIWWPCRDGKWRRVPGRVDESQSIGLQESGEEQGYAPEASSGDGRMGNTECNTTGGTYRGECGESGTGMQDKRKGSEVRDDLTDDGNNGRISDTNAPGCPDRPGQCGGTGTPETEGEHSVCGCSGGVQGGRIPDTEIHGQSREQTTWDRGTGTAYDMSGNTPGHERLETQPGILPVANGVSNGVVQGGTPGNAEVAGWPTAGMMDGLRTGKEEDYDNYLIQKEKHAKKGVNKHFHLNYAADSVAPPTIMVDPDLFPLAPSTKGRVGLLKGAGNAIVPGVAAKFITAMMEVIDEQNEH